MDMLFEWVAELFCSIFGAGAGKKGPKATRLRLGICCVFILVVVIMIFLLKPFE